MNWQQAARYQVDLKGFKTIQDKQENDKRQPDASSQIHMY